MNIGDLAQWAVVLFVVVGLVATWVRNGRSVERKTGAYERDIKSIKSDLSHPEYGLFALSQSINDVKGNCRGVTAGFKERLIAHDREIKEVKGLNRGKTDECR